MQTHEHAGLDQQMAWGHAEWNIVLPEDVPVVAIAGASGKSTTATLVRAILRSAGLRPFNSMQTLYDRADRLTPRDRVVLTLDWPPPDAVDRISVFALTGVAADELPSGVDASAFADTCRGFAASAQVVVVNADDAQALSVAAANREVRRVSLSDRAVDAGVHEGEMLLLDDGMTRRAGNIVDTSLRARPFVTDMLVAAAASLAVGADAGDVRRAAGKYRTPADHFELLGTVGGVAWVNDAAATRPGRTAAVLEHATEPLVLVSGGLAGGQPLRRWSHAAASAHRVLLYGSAGTAMAEAVASINGVERVVRCADLDDAVDIARRLAVPGDTVVLSPGCLPEGSRPGARFRELVARLQPRQEAA